MASTPETEAMRIVPPTMTRPARPRAWRGPTQLLPPFTAATTTGPAEAAAASRADEDVAASAPPTGADVPMHDALGQAADANVDEFDDMMVLTETVEPSAIAGGAAEMDADRTSAVETAMPEGGATAERPLESTDEHVADRLIALAARIREEGLRSLGTVADADELSRLLAAVISGYVGRTEMESR